MIRFRRATFNRATDMLVEIGSFYTAPLLVAPQTRSWKMVRFRRTTFNRATDMLVENGSF